MDSLQKAYIEEAQDLFESLEQALLEMERTPEKPELIEEVFRVMHTLKGNSSMFGYERITELVHDLETIYDLVREGKMNISGEILNQTFATLDHLRRSIEDPNLENPNNRRIQDELVLKINFLLKGGGQSERSVDDLKLDTVSSKEINTYHINFVPDEDIMANGTNLLYLIDELHSLGKCIAVPHFFNLPDLKDFQVERCYASWDIFLATDAGESCIQEVFIFVEDQAQITINLLETKNLLSDKDFVASVSQGHFGDENIDVNAISQHINPVTEIQTTEEVKLPVTETKDLKEKAVSSVRVSSDKLDGLMNIVSEMVTTQASLSLHSDNNYNPGLEIISENVEKLTRKLRDTAFAMTLIPVNKLFSRFQRMIRDFSHEMDKDVRLVTVGGETELDKGIIENLTDPLMHILRNSMDHGIEDARTRTKLGKPEKGTVLLKAFHSGANVHILIKDDGSGIDTEAVRSKAIAKGLISPDATLSKKEILDLVFIPGFSTAEEITDVSGRGVGMDVVRRQIEEIRGEVEIESKLNEGTTITIMIPLTLSIIDGLLVRIDETFLILPLSVVEKIHPVGYDQIEGAFNNLIALDDQQLPFLDLRDEFDIQENRPENAQVVVVAYEEKRMGLSIDEVIGEYQAVIKPVGYHYRNLDIISGATILGDGTVALVLDTNRVIRNFTSNNLTEELVI